jgi:hypothetical protein
MSEFKKNTIYGRKTKRIVVSERASVSAIDVVLRLFVRLDHQSGRHILEEQADLIKYSKLQLLGKLIYEYVSSGCFAWRLTTLLIELFRSNNESAMDERKDLNASESAGNGDISPI